MKFKTNPNLTNVMPLHLQPKWVTQCLRHLTTSCTADPIIEWPHCNELLLFWMGEKWKITHARKAGHTMRWPRSIRLRLLPALAFSFSSTIIWHDENESRIIIIVWYIWLFDCIYLYVYKFLYNDDRGCTIRWPVLMFWIFPIYFFSPATSFENNNDSSHHWYQIITLDAVIFGREKSQLCLQMLMLSVIKRWLSIWLSWIVCACMYYFCWLRFRSFFLAFICLPRGIVFIFQWNELPFYLHNITFGRNEV